MVEEQRSSADKASNERKPRFARGTQELDPIQCETPEETSNVDDPIAEIVHDLKSPLSAISLEATVLGERMRRGERSGSMRSIERIHHNVQYLDRLILDLLDASSVANGALTLCLEPTELRCLIEGALDRIITPRDHHRVRLDAPRAHMLVIDALRIERVISNLIDNALKYTPATGRIFVRLRCDDGVARVSVIDEGPGLRPAEAARVFDQYQRASTARGRSGCGLGLYVSKKIVEAHGGRIGVDSIRGVGSRFFFELPAS